ncbi:acyl-CoA dehydrogenase family protein [Pyrobaculum neutrophilum]|uniref:Acyl-CoA dehydrogenase domain protein n=1 Tax=Pyrobaculum neutrophilum (strain DSM 2338 / JCM 9278 / NBRC 100436 / V24Sta) TaxID=444157 RepID=B1Y8W6_PYRNV|nr:acyl-CoA dehydrogenase family protein [Pyrobaculum neutrophilum]ACB40195.1 acyl-CoA dehydrogenase domain protein [Pyrobaculum neutrophilum V24Sta]
MDFGLSREDKLFVESVRSFAERVIAPRWVEIDEGRWPMAEVAARLGEAGLLGMTLSSRYGGQEATFLQAALAVEELAYADPSLATPVYVLLETAWPYVVQRHGRDEAKEEVLPEVAAGRAFVGIASTEPQGGSDVASVQTKAVKEGGLWRLYGEKNMVTGVSTALALPYGGGAVAVARTGAPEDKHRGVTLFLALLKRRGRQTPGFTYRDWDEVGRRGLPTGYLTLEGLPVEDVFVVGELNGGFKIAMEGFNLARTVIGAASVGAARWLLDRGLEWIRQRSAFGRPIASYQSVSFKFAELYARLEAARLSVYKAAWIADRFYGGDVAFAVQDVATAGAVAKYLAVGTAVETALEVMKWFGGASYFRETNVARSLLGLLSYYVGAEGAENILKLIIARNTVGREFV